MAKRKARVRLVDTTFRDAQQSLLGGFLRTEEILPIAAKMDSIGFAAMEAFGGATFETQLRIHEDPWEYLRKLKKATPNTPIQALIRGQNLVSKRNFADDVVELFIKHAAKCGVDVFRVFDPLNDLRNMEASIAAALKAKNGKAGSIATAISGNRKRPAGNPHVVRERFRYGYARFTSANNSPSSQPSPWDARASHSTGTSFSRARTSARSKVSSLASPAESPSESSRQS